MDELNEKLSNEIANSLETIANVSPADDMYTDTVKNIKTLSDIKIELDRIELEREASQIQEMKDIEDRKAGVVKVVIVVGGTILLTGLTIFSEEIGGKVIRSKAFQFVSRLLPKAL